MAQLVLSIAGYEVGGPIGAKVIERLLHEKIRRTRSMIASQSPSLKRRSKNGLCSTISYPFESPTELQRKSDARSSLSATIAPFAGPRLLCADSRVSSGNAIMSAVN
jgi:hypothetical protein